MVNIPMKSSAPLTKQTVTSVNHLKVQGAKSSRDILSINYNQTQRSMAAPAQSRPATAAPRPAQNAAAPAAAQRTAPVPPQNRTPAHTAAILPGSAPLPFKPIPPLRRTIQKGQKTTLSASGQIARIKACLGWNTTNAECDVDVSAFMLNSNGTVIGDSWFVFYGQTVSPDHSTVFCANEATDRESITIDLSKINSAVSKVVFVLTINEALEKNLNFSMLRDAYIRILDASNNNELASFKVEEYYSNITSLMLGEIYLYNGTWKFNAIGNGVARDLAGLCEFYGVQVI